MIYYRFKFVVNLIGIGNDFNSEIVVSNVYC